MSPYRFAVLPILAAASLVCVARAQVELIAGFNFGQFLQSGEPALDGVSFERVGSIPGNWTATVAPGPEDTGEYKVQNNLSTVFSAGTAVLHFDGTNGSSAWSGTSVNVVERGALDSTNAQLVTGEPMYSGDDRNLHLQFTSEVAGQSFAITLGTLGYSDYDASAFSQPNDFNLTFAAYNATGASASIEWFFDGQSLGVTTASAGNGNFEAFNLDLVSGFFGKSSATLVAKVTGDIVIDHIQINGVKAAAATFTDQPDSQTVTAGDDVVFSVTVSGAATPAYRWFFGSTPLSDGAGVSGATTAMLTLTDVAPSRAGSYRVEVNNNGAVAQSDAATLVVNVLPSFVAQPPAAVSANPGSRVVLEVEAFGSPAPAYQWFKGDLELVDGDRISGTATAELTIDGLLAGDAGDYTVLITNAAGSLRSSATALTVTAEVIAPAIQTQPAPITAVVGQIATFRVSATGTPAPSYQWFKGESPLSDGPAVSGATTATLRITPSSLADAGAYRVVVTNVVDSAESESALLTVWTLPSIPPGSAPTGGRVNVGGRFVFRVGSEGVPAATYQWFKDGELIDGATGAELVIDPATAADAGDYTVVVTNDAGSVESIPVALEVTTPPSITSDPVSRIVGAGASVTFQVAAIGSPELQYRWFKDGEPLDGADGPSLFLASAEAADAGDYTVVVSNVGGSVTSAVAQLEVFVNVERSAGTKLFVPGTQLALDSGFVAASGYRFQWLRDGRPIPGATSSTYLIDSADYADSGTYSVRVSSASGRLLTTIKVTRIRVTVAGKYHALLRDFATDKPVGRVSLSIESAGGFTGTVAYADGKTYPLKGRLAFAAQPHLGAATVVIRRVAGLSALELEIGLDALAGRLECGLVDSSSDETLAVGATSAGLPASARPAWSGAYDFTLAPLPTELPEQPMAAVLLKATVAGKGGTMKLTGKLADNTKLTASVPSSTDAGYAIWVGLYSGKGRVAGELNLVAISESDYEADLESSGAFVWFRPANPKSSMFPGGIDLLLAPELVKP